MAYSFPLSLADFLDVLPISSTMFDLPDAGEMSKTAGGEVITASLGARLRQGTIKLDKMTAAQEDVAMAMLDIARRPGATFLLTDRKKPWPRADFGGALISGSSPTIAAISTDTREITLAGLPAGYVISRGDWMSFTYAASPLRYALHRAATTVTANGSGIAGPMEVSPNIRTGATVGRAVALRKAICKAVVIPGSVDVGTRSSSLTKGVSFSWSQTLR